MEVMRSKKLSYNSQDAKGNLEGGLEGEGGEGQPIVWLGSELLAALSPVNVDTADVYKPPQGPYHEERAREHVATEAAMVVSGHGRHAIVRHPVIHHTMKERSQLTPNVKICRATRRNVPGR